MLEGEVGQPIEQKPVEKRPGLFARLFRHGGEQPPSPHPEVALGRPPEEVTRIGELREDLGREEREGTAGQTGAAIREEIDRLVGPPPSEQGNYLDVKEWQERRDGVFYEKSVPPITEGDLPQACGFATKEAAERAWTAAIADVLMFAERELVLVRFGHSPRLTEFIESLGQKPNEEIFQLARKIADGTFNGFSSLPGMRDDVLERSLHRMGQKYPGLRLFLVAQYYGDDDGTYRFGNGISTYFLGDLPSAFAYSGHQYQSPRPLIIMVEPAKLDIPYVSGGINVRVGEDTPSWSNEGIVIEGVGLKDCEPVILKAPATEEEREEFLKMYQAKATISA